MDAKHGADKCTAEEREPLPSTPVPMTSSSGVGSEHERERISYEIAQQPPLKLKKLKRIVKTAKSDENLFRFEVSARYPPCLRRWY